jgi:uncharacterized repeat protein (TIGR02543 family)
MNIAKANVSVEVWGDANSNKFKTLIISHIDTRTSQRLTLDKNITVQEGMELTAAPVPVLEYEGKLYYPIPSSVPVTFTMNQAESITFEYGEGLPKNYYITYNTNGGTGTAPFDDNEYGENDTATVSGSNGIARPGYTFAGWGTETNGGTTYSPGGTITVTGDITLYAQWQPINYSLFFDYQGATSGDNETTRQATYDQPVGSLPNPAKTGFTFGGWYSGKNGASTQYTASTIYKNENDTTLYAHWTTSSQANGLIFHYENATSPHSPAGKEATYGSAVGGLPAPERTGYTFGGWHTQQSGQGTQYTSATIYQSLTAVDLYAHWIGGQHNINLDYQSATGGDNIQSINVTVGQPVGGMPFPEKTGYGFDGWYAQTNGQGTQYLSNTIYGVGGPATLYANWTSNLYSMGLMFHYQGAAEKEPIGKEAYYGQPVGDLPAPTRPGHTLNGWYTLPDGAGTKYDKNTIFQSLETVHLYAHWTTQQYKLTYNINGGTGTAPADAKEYTYNELATVKSATLAKDGYIFSGWNIDTDINRVVYQSGEHIVMNGNKTLYAYWTTEARVIEIPVEVPAPAPGPSEIVYVPYPYYVYPPDAPPSTVMPPPSDNTGKKAKTYTVTYNANGGTGNAPMDNKKYRMDDEIRAKDASTLRREGYTFAGWCISPNGNNSTYQPNHHFWISRDITLYALWVPVR